jgi:hypothetical protein
VSRVQLRPFRTAEEDQALYERTYPLGYRHDVWPDHVERVTASVEMIRRYGGSIRRAADLSCGDGAILKGIDDLLEQAYIGDLNGARGDYPLRTHVRTLEPGPLPDSLAGFQALPVNVLPVDLFVLSETLEHVTDPDDLLQKLTGVSRYLFLSTPLDEHPSVGNPEHYWGWGQSDLHHMLWESGWSPLEVRLLVPESTRHIDNAYTYQLWMAVHR